MAARNKYPLFFITGGAGFCGSHSADEIVATTDWNVVVIDAGDRFNFDNPEEYER